VSPRLQSPQPTVDDINKELAQIEQEASIEVLRKPYLSYIPNHSQFPAHRSSAFERWIFAGNGMGKDAFLVNEFGWHCLGEYPEWYPEEGRINPKREAIQARYI
jgi:hypothetical protein